MKSVYVVAIGCLICDFSLMMLLLPSPSEWADDYYEYVCKDEYLCLHGYQQQLTHIIVLIHWITILRHIAGRRCFSAWYASNTWYTANAANAHIS